MSLVVLASGSLHVCTACVHLALWTRKVSSWSFHALHIIESLHVCTACVHLALWTRKVSSWSFHALHIIESLHVCTACVHLALWTRKVSSWSFHALHIIESLHVCTACVHLALWTRKVSCGSFHALHIISKLLFIHSDLNWGTCTPLELKDGRLCLPWAVVTHSKVSEYLLTYFLMTSIWPRVWRTVSL